MVFTLASMKSLSKALSKRPTDGFTSNSLSTDFGTSTILAVTSRTLT